MYAQLNDLRDEYQRLFSLSPWVFAIAIGACALFVAYSVNYQAGQFATERAGAPLADVILDSFPRVPTDFLHESGSQPLIGLALVLVFFLPRLMPAMLIGVASIVFVRSVFINMTQLGLYFDAVRIDGSYVTFGGDLFFSGHVAIPVMLGLIFWEYTIVRYLFFTAGIILGTSALLGHYHYSIDVFAAPFIAHGVYTVLRNAFPAIMRGFHVQ